MKPIHVILATVVLLLGVSMYNIPPETPKDLTGAYSSGAGPDQILFSVDPSNRFYCADQQNDRFIAGRVEPRGEGVWQISCLDPANAEVIPDQELSWDRTGFSMTFSGESPSFQKNGDIPVIVGDTDCYS